MQVDALCQEQRRVLDEGLFGDVGGYDPNRHCCYDPRRAADKQEYTAVEWNAHAESLQEELNWIGKGGNRGGKAGGKGGKGGGKGGRQSGGTKGNFNW